MNTKFLLGLIAFSALTVSPYARAEDWGVSETTKADSDVPRENSIERRRVVIRQNIKIRNAPSITRRSVDAETARKIRLEEKTQELIGQLETLIKRPGQSEREGELKMRLAELYFERAQATATRESEVWEEAIKQWEDSKKGARPTLSTPKADQFRNQALNLYQELERLSRGGDLGKSRMIRRDEVLFFLSSTLNDLGRGKTARPYYEELVAKFPQSPRLFGARLALADQLFEAGEFAKAIPHYLRIAAGENAPSNSEGEVSNLRVYALYKLAWCYQNTGEYAKTVQALQRTLEASKATSSDQRIAFEKEALADLTRAFPLAGQYNEAEAWFEKSGYGSAELLEQLRKNTAEIARDRGRFDIAFAAIDKTLQQNPKSPAARELALDKARILGKQGKMEAYAKALGEVGKNYGQGSAWLSAQDMSDEDKKALVEEGVSELRREAKDQHRIAQRRDKAEFYRAPRWLYEAYFTAVPDPNPDSAENIHEMRFYYAELLYKIKDYPAAAKAYASVGAGKYAAAADYSKILALRGAAAADKSGETSKELLAATDDFIKAHPQDERAGELLYASAYESFKTGNTESSVGALHQLIERFPDKDKGVEAAQRILFITEKNGDLKQALAESELILANKKLMATGGKELSDQVYEYRNKALFKQVEAMPENSAEDQLAKSRAYRDLGRSNQLQANLREKGLNNALVYARKGGDAVLVKENQGLLLASFPASNYAKNLYLEKAEELLKEARWPEALAEYERYLKIHGAKKDETTESAQWNKLFVQSRLDGFYQPEFHPARDLPNGLLAAANAHLETYPKSKNREELLSLLAFRKSAKLDDLKKLRKTPALNDRERALLDEAEIVVEARKGDAKSLAALVKKHPAASAKTQLVKDALAEARFQTIEVDYQAYSKKKLDYKGARFVRTLKEKLAMIEKLEKAYMSVVAYGSGEPAMKSLERLSKMYRTLAGDIGKAPGVPKEALAPYTDPLNNKGISFLKTCLEKATEYKITGAGVEGCRRAAYETGVDKPVLDREISIEPRWIPASASQRPLLRALAHSLAQNRFGEFHLALGLLEKAEPPLSAEERAELQNLTGLASWKMRENQAAVRIFRQASDVAGGDLAAVRSSAMKNLAALYIQVRDFNNVLEVTSTMPASDSDVAWIRGLAFAGQGKSSEAAAALDAGTASTQNVGALWFNKGIAWANAGDFAKAAESMNRYVELETPAGSHLSRVLLRDWKAKVK